jgi:hypothetical protein
MYLHMAILSAGRRALHILPIAVAILRKSDPLEQQFLKKAALITQSSNCLRLAV